MAVSWAKAKLSCAVSEQEEGFCCVQYQVCTLAAEVFPFTLDQSSDVSQIDTNCATDFIDIVGSSAICNQNVAAAQLTDRYCGNNFNDVGELETDVQICDCTPPFSVDIFTNGAADGANNNNRGKCHQKHILFDDLPLLY